MEPIGLTLDVKPFERTNMYTKCNEPATHRWRSASARRGARTTPTGYTFADPLFGSACLFPSCCNYGLVGASPETCSGSPATTSPTVPSVDDKITDASAQTGDARFQCWADLDTYC